jgi:hypothetical protein
LPARRDRAPAGEDDRGEDRNDGAPHRATGPFVVNAHPLDPTSACARLGLADTSPNVGP